MVETPSGDLIMLGAADNPLTGWSPTQLLRRTGVRPRLLVLTNYDKDHLSDLPNFTPEIRPATIMRNYDADIDDIVDAKIAKNGEVAPGVAQAADWVNTVFTGARVKHDYGMEVKHFYNHPTHFGYDDTNNLSVVSFLADAGVGVLNCSDIEAAGLAKLIEREDFREVLGRTNVIIAPHHGRINGYLAEMFEHTTPDAVIISDKPIVHDTQNHNRYAKHAKGIPFNDGSVRHVLTTRNDGKITIQTKGMGSYQIATE